MRKKSPLNIFHLQIFTISNFGKYVGKTAGDKFKLKYDNSSDVYLGLFGYVVNNGKTIFKDFNIENCYLNINDNSIVGNLNVGLLAGYAIGNVSNVNIIDTKSGIPIMYTELELYILDFRKESFKSEKTLRKRATFICSFLNYLLWHEPQVDGSEDSQINK